MKYKTKRLIILSNEEKELLQKTDKIIEEIKCRMLTDSVNKIMPEVNLTIYNDYGEPVIKTFSDIKITDNILYDLYIASEIISNEELDNDQ